MIDYVTGPNPDIRFNYLRLITFYSLPIAVILLSFLFWSIKGCCSRLSCCSRISPQELLDKAIATISIIWFLFYPTIVSYLAQSINCTSIEGTPRLYDDLEEICYQDKHLIVIYAISIPGLIIWAFGLPLLGFYLTRRFLHQLRESEFHSDPRIYNNLQARFKLRLGFLTQGYEDRYYYWEVVLLLRKTILVLLLTFLAPVSSGVQSLSAILLLIFSLVYQILKKPFYDDRLNHLEATSLGVQIMIIYFGLYYQAGKNDEFVSGDFVMWLIFGLIIIVSIQFIAVFAVRMRVEMLKATVK